MSGPELLSKADKKAASTGSGGGGGLSSFFGGGSSSKLEEAHDLYNSAGNAFKLDRHWKESGDAFCKAAEVALRMGEKDDAGNDFWNAAKSYKKSHPELAVAALSRTITILCEKGRFRQAADRQKEIGEIFKQDGMNLRGAIDALEQAGEWYAQEEAAATANACFKDVAELAAMTDPPDWGRAVYRFEQVAAASLNSPLTKYSVKEYYLKAGLCRLAQGDEVATKRAIEGYCAQDSSFNQTREFKFLSTIAQAYEQRDPDAFTQAVAEFDQLTRLDNWKTNVLLRIKNEVTKPAEDVDWT